MWQELFVNACILITIIFITSQIFKNSGLYSNSPIRIKMLLGVFGGLSAIILMHFSIPVAPQVILDFREMCIILVAMFGGMLPAIITGVITTIYRLAFFDFAQEAYIAAFGIIATSIGCGILSGLKMKEKLKGWIMLFYSLIIRGTLYYVVLEDKNNALKVITNLSISSIVLSVGVFYLVNYLVTSHRLLKNLKIESTQDYLTGLSNKRLFNRKYKAILNYTMEHHDKLAYVIIDIDHFKAVNDTYGHSAGDAVLKELGKVLRSTCRESYMTSRIGGEEFAVIIRNENLDAVKTKAEQIRTNVLSHKFSIGSGTKIKITVSLGIAIYPDTVEDITKLMDAADTKLYEAKRTGRNKVCI